MISPLLRRLQHYHQLVEPASELKQHPVTIII
jgi:hypothetical protein